MTRPAGSSPELLVLHALRLKGMADAAAVASRFSLDRQVVDELILEYESSGLIASVGFADLSGWTLTDAGRAEDLILLAAELEATGARSPITGAHEAFVSLNGPFLATVTRWQIRPTPWDALASNDHSDWRWDERVLQDLDRLLRRLRPVCDQLTDALARFDGYMDRLVGAHARVARGQREWVDQPGIDSCHMIWFELHEDLLATLGLERGQER